MILSLCSSKNFNSFARNFAGVGLSYLEYIFHFVAVVGPALTLLGLFKSYGHVLSMENLHTSCSEVLLWVKDLFLPILVTMGRER